MKSRGARTPADSKRNDREIRGKGGHNTVGSPAVSRSPGLGADTAVSIERKVVSGHAYAILAPDAVVGGRCGQDKPTFRRQMVFLTHNPWAPVLPSTGALVMEV